MPGERGAEKCQIWTWATMSFLYSFSGGALFLGAGKGCTSLFCQDGEGEMFHEEGLNGSNNGWDRSVAW
jgi:hypothetical protein